MYVGGHRAQQIAAEGVFPLCGRPELSEVLEQLFVAHRTGGAEGDSMRHYIRDMTLVPYEIKRG